MSTRGRENRTVEQLRHHYQVEKELADKLRSATKQDRRWLYGALYDELFRRVPDHPQLTRKSSESLKREALHKELSLIKPFLRPSSVFMEVGPGDCALSFAVARLVQEVIAVDVSEEITRTSAAPDNFRLLLSDGCSVPALPASVDVCYSNQLMEHLHPDDAEEQLENIHRALKPGGVYVCITPNVLTGPHDISSFFDPVATGFHLKEYSVEELADLFRKVGFTRFDAAIAWRGYYSTLDASYLMRCERLLSSLPDRLRRGLTRNRLVGKVLGCHVVGQK